MSDRRQSITIVGASLAGLRGAEALRKADFEGSITLIGDEAYPPYDRPPLSKQVLAGEWAEDRIQLADAEKLTALNLDLRLGTRAAAFDLATRQLTTIDQSEGSERVETIDGLLLACGARPRTLPGTEDMAGVHTLRTNDDAAAIGAALDAGASRVAVIGAGFIGAEVAATIRQKGVEVTLIESLAYPMARVLGEDIGMLCGEIQTDHGVDLRCGVGVETIEGGGAANTVERVILTDGTVIETDLVVIGIGVIPNTEWLEGSGLNIDDGVVCDSTCLAEEGVTAAGDIARWYNRRFDEVMRVEHWENAADQAGFAARRLLLDDSEAVSAQEYQPVPWFWSDQYDRKIQMAGRPRSTDHTMLATGSLDERRFAMIYGRDGKLTGVFGMNRPRHVMKYRMAIDDGMSWDEAVATVDK